MSRVLCRRKYRQCAKRHHFQKYPKQSDEFFLSLFLVHEKDRGVRPVFCLKGLNKFIHHHHVKMERIETLKSISDWGRLDDQMDIKVTYFVIPISKEGKSFLQFLSQDWQFQFMCCYLVYVVCSVGFYQTLKPIVTLQLGFDRFSACNVLLSF